MNIFRNFIVMKKFFCTLLLMTAVVGVENVFAQFKGNIWCFGDSAGINFTPPMSFFKSGSSFARAGCSSISDSLGNLIFYGASGNTTNSHNGLVRKGKLFNRNHNKLFNGDTLVGGEWYHDMIILPKSVTDSTFYVIMAGVVVPDTGLFYCVVDMKLQGGLGQVIQKNIQIENHPVQDMLAAVRHGNGRDWWLVTRRYTYAPSNIPNNEFWVYKVDSTGIHLRPVQNVGYSIFGNGGDISFNSDGTKLVISSLNSYIGVITFDRCHGFLHSPIIVEPPSTPGNYLKFYTSVVFSPNGNLLYALSNQQGYNIWSKLYQFDLTVANIPASRVLVDSLPLDAGPAGMELAPDGKIYISSAYIGLGSGWPYPPTCWNFINENLSVINHPDSLGLACDFQPFSFYLGGARTYYGLPNNPDYELGAWVGSPCDTLSVGVDDNVPEQQVFFQAWYNSEWNMIHVNASKLKGRAGSLRLFDIEGRLVYEKKVEVIAGGYVTGEIPMNAVANGVYLVNLITEAESISSKTIKF